MRSSRFFMMLAALVTLVVGQGCNIAGDDVTGVGGGDSSSTKYDGTYMFVLNGCTYNSAGTACIGDGVIYKQKVFIIQNGKITVGLPNPYVATGSVTNSQFGNVSFTGFCPLMGAGMSGTATYTGILNPPTSNKWGQGHYTCTGSSASFPGVGKTYLWSVDTKL
jgi:hypothetical protein